MFIVVVACEGFGKLDHVVLITPYIAKWISAIFCDIESFAKFFEKFSKIIQIYNFLKKIFKQFPKILPKNGKNIS
jgi:hypothetical protein